MGRFLSTSTPTGLFWAFSCHHHRIHPWQWLLRGPWNPWYGFCWASYISLFFVYTVGSKMYLQKNWYLIFTYSDLIHWYMYTALSFCDYLCILRWNASILLGIGKSAISWFFSLPICCFGWEFGGHLLEDPPIHMKTKQYSAWRPWHHEIELL